MSFDHCLRPRFTENILAYLQNGTSVNVVIPDITEEAKRLAADIQACEFPRVLMVDMRYSRGSFSAFLSQLQQQYYHNASDFSAFLSALEQDKQKSIILLNHFDALGENDVDAGFNLDFYERLNSLKNFRSVALLVVTQTPYQGLSFTIKGKLTTSKLDIQETEYLPQLTDFEARQEIVRQDLQLDEKQIFQLMERVQHDYALLNHFTRQIKNHPTQQWADIASFIQQLKTWHKQYKRQQTQGWYRLKKIVDAVHKFANIVKLDYLIGKIKPLSKIWIQGKD